MEAAMHSASTPVIAVTSSHVFLDNHFESIGEGRPVV